MKLSASTYSPRLANLFKTDFYYKWTVGIFGASVGFNFLLLYSMSIVPPKLLYSLIILSGFIAFEVFYSLFNFVNRILEKTTPEGIIKTIDNYMELKYIKSQVKASKNKKEESDPFYLLLSVIESAVSKRDSASASFGIKILSEKIQLVLNYEQLEQDKFLLDSIENLSKNRIPELMENALSQNIYQIAKETAEEGRSISELCLTNRHSLVFEYVIRGQTNLIGEMGFSKDEDRLRDQIIENIIDLVDKGRENNQLDSSARAVRLLGWEVALSLVRRDEHTNFHKYTHLQINGFPKILKGVIESSSNLQNSDSNSWHIIRDRSDINSEKAILIDCYNSMAEMASAAIRYEIKTKKAVVDWESVSYGWTNCLKSSKKNGLDEFAKVWYGTILYLSYIDAMSDDEVMKRCKFLQSYKPGESFAEEVIDELINNSGRQIRGRIDLLPGQIDPVEYPRTGSNSPPLKRPEKSFKEWLKEEKAVLKMRARKLR